ncbi:hypothetical protein [Streptomyces sp. MMG1121]|uniref:hypothetical protein n=1 Tax=Streptomyces sp. MMG1121 TaxID=1415544 RepID=UPI0006AF135A|nr:hypothetical protein [Streptomyces sp. MMG1121]KOV59639.1 hypothetical protein ADK64_32915 [Streptomyces sp. MMG1121]
MAALWAAVEEAVPRTAVAGAVATVETLVPEDDGSAEARMREKLALRHHAVRPFPSTSTRTTRAPANDAASGRLSGRGQ